MAYYQWNFYCKLNKQSTLPAKVKGTLPAKVKGTLPAKVKGTLSAYVSSGGKFCI